MRKGFSVSATIEALQQFLISRTLCDELAVKGDDCPSWRVSLVVKFNIWLNKTRRVPIMKLLISIRNNGKQINEKIIKTTTERRRTEKLLICFLPVENLPIRPFIFYHAKKKKKMYCIRVASIKSPVVRVLALDTYLLMGLPLRYGGSPPRRRESEPYPGGRLPTLRFSRCGQEHSFRYHEVHLICPQTDRCWMFGFRSCATPLGTSRRGTLYTYINETCASCEYDRLSGCLLNQGVCLLGRE